MMQIQSLVSRLRALLLRSTVQKEIAEEIQTHLELETRKHLNAGVPADKARRQAQIALGGMVRTVEECREQRGLWRLEALLRDGRHALCAFRRSPVFALSVVLTMAVAIGGNVTVFGFCRAILLATLPVPNPRQLRLVSVEHPPVPPDDYFSFPDLRKMQQAAAGTAALTGFTNTVDVHLLNASGTSSTAKARLVPGNFFSVLQVIPLAGRVFTERDNQPDAEPVAVISRRFWEERFGSVPSVIGRRLLIQRKPVTVAGILPEGFDGVEPGVRPDIWMPLSVQTAIGYGGYASMNGIDFNKPWMWQEVSWLHILARSPADPNGKRLNAALTGLVKAEIAAELPHISDTRQRAILLGARIRLTSAAGGLPHLRRQFALPLRILFSLVAVLLFSGCINIVNLLLARARAHTHEAALRLALGSTRAALIANRVTETLLLIGAGGLLSLPLAIWGSRMILHWLVIDRDLQIDVSPDWTMLLFTAAMTCVAGFSVALLPALRTAGAAAALHSFAQRTRTGAAETAAGRRGSALLVGAQFALTTASLITAGLLTHTLLNYEHLDIGLDRQHVLSAPIDPSAAGYNNAGRSEALYRRLVSSIDRIPGVISSAVAGCGLMDEGCATLPAAVEGEEKPRSEEALVERNYVGAGYFATVGTRLLRGRGIADNDTQGAAPIGVVNTQFERDFLRGRNALGRTLLVEDRKIRVVGVVQDARSDDIHRRALPYLYLPVEQAPAGWNVSHIEVRTSGNPREIVSSVRAAILQINRAIPVAGIQTLAEEADRGLASELLVGKLAGVFSALILIVSALGLYGVLAYEVSRRRAELAIRFAVGATRGNVVAMVCTRALLIWICGCAAGCALSLFVRRFIQALLFGTGTVDFKTYAASLLVLLTVAGVAVWLPAARAASVDPVSVLRSE